MKNRREVEKVFEPAIRYIITAEDIRSVPDDPRLDLGQTNDHLDEDVEEASVEGADNFALLVWGNDS